MPSTTLTAKDVAIILDMTPDDVAAMAREGTLRGRKKGRQWRFAKRDVIYFARKVKREPRE